MKKSKLKQAWLAWKAFPPTSTLKAFGDLIKSSVSLNKQKQGIYNTGKFKKGVLNLDK